MHALTHRLTLLFVLACAFGGAAAGQDGSTRVQSWSGVLVTANCTADEAFDEADKCTTPMAGIELALYDDTTRHVFKLEPQPNTVAAELGASVTVRGTLEGEKIRISSLELLKSIGLAVGQKAPGFVARDQSGREQSLNTLKRPGGTVLLFFRSADW